MSDRGFESQYVLQCMDIWSGNRSIENEVATPGLELFVYSQPYRGDSAGGDVHYVSLCAGGVVTRLILADVAGHGTAVADSSQMLRSLMRRFMNAKSQNRLIRDLNREFSQLSNSGRFATAVVGTYLSHRRRLLICNAGHPRPLWYRRSTRRWRTLDGALVASGEVSNLPLGLDEATRYQQFGLSIAEGDMVVLYTDALTESRNAEGMLLQERGLLELVAGLPAATAREVGAGLLEGVRRFSAGHPPEDDVTVIVLKFSDVRRIPGLAERLRGYSKVLGLRPV